MKSESFISSARDERQIVSVEPKGRSVGLADVSFGKVHNIGLKYRAEIDGLRAVAVLAVVGFHAFPSTVRGGFVGVDVFFVISGFLISTIIFQSVDSGTFGYLEFYSRRIKRIFPALFLVLPICIAFGWIFLLPDEFKLLGRQVAAGAAFMSNILSWHEAGYFDILSEFKPLLHLWSLGIEEQFYIFFPLLVGVLWKKGQRTFAYLTALVAVSFGLNVMLIGSDPVGTFYLPFTRIWELLAGSILAYVTVFQAEAATASWPKRLGNRTGRYAEEAASLFGILLILAAILLTDKYRQFPGWWALLPVAGALLVIGSGSSTLVNRWFLSSRLMVFFGLISYPLYLWHWPILAFCNILEYGIPAQSIRVGAVVLSIFLATVTWILIERPVRRDNRVSVPIVLFILIFCCGIAGLVVYSEDGFEFRSITRNEQNTLYWRSRELDKEIRGKFKTRGCDDLGQINQTSQKYCRSYGVGTEKTIVVWGDSHVEAWAPVFFEIADQEHYRIVMFSHVGCAPLVQVGDNSERDSSFKCAVPHLAENIVSGINSLNPTRLFLISRWSLYTRGPIGGWSMWRALRIWSRGSDGGEVHGDEGNMFLTDLVATLRAMPSSMPVTILRTFPTLNAPLGKGLVKGVPIAPSRDEHMLVESIPNRAIDAAHSMFKNVSVFDPADRLCVESCKIVKDNIVYYVDDNHISAQGSLQFKNAMVRLIDGN